MTPSTLTLTTRAALSAAVAEYCAGWMRCERNGRMVFYDPEGGHVVPHELHNYIPPYAESADAVIPLLAAWRDQDSQFRQVHIGIHGKPSFVELRGSALGTFYASGKTLPVAACLALLRAAGHTIRFTETK